MPNPWDVGSAKLLEALGFEALATTSAGFAHSIGKTDGEVDRDAVLAHCAALVAATDVPISADLENGYADDPDGVAETVRLAAASGLAGCSIEDLPLGREGGPYPLEAAAERIRAAAEAAHALPFPFILTARAENFLDGHPDLADTIARLQAFQEAGADVLFAPGLRKKEDIEAVVRSVDRPVNMLMGLQGVNFSLMELSAIGVRRISVGSSLSRLAYDAALRAGAEMHDRGTFTFVDQR